MNDPTALYHLLFVYALEDFELLECKNNVYFSRRDTWESGKMDTAGLYPQVSESSFLTPPHNDLCPSLWPHCVGAVRD